MKFCGHSLLFVFFLLFLLISPTDGIFFRRRRRRRFFKREFGDPETRDVHPSGIKCEPKSTHPAHGTVSCTDGNNDKSVCHYTCDEGYQLSDPGASSRSCEGQTWSEDEPECQAI